MSNWEGVDLLLLRSERMLPEKGRFCTQLRQEGTVEALVVGLVSPLALSLAYVQMFLSTVPNWSSSAVCFSLLPSRDAGIDLSFANLRRVFRVPPPIGTVDWIHDRAIKLAAETSLLR